MTSSFEGLGLREELLRAIVESGYTTPTPIQEQAVPYLLSGRDILGQAQTGTGKTAAFSLPMLNMMDMDAKGVQALVLTPTRELCTQVANTIYRYGQHLGVKVVPIYGGQSYDRQARRIERGVHVVVATPGRLLDLLKQKMITLNTVKYAVLDEADEMLKMGFIDDVASILSHTPKDRQTALFSATLPQSIQALAANYMTNPHRIQVQNKTMTVAMIEQRYYFVHESSKIPALSRLLEMENVTSGLIFSRTRAGAAQLAEALMQRGYRADWLSGDLSQDARETTLRRFRNGEVPLLVATDVVARGVDIPDVSHVFNFDLPQDSEDYVHRIGRTGRAGRAGIAITLVTPREMRRLKVLEHYAKQNIPRAELPSLEAIRDRRDEKFAAAIEGVLNDSDLETGMAMVEHFVGQGFDLAEVAAAALQFARKEELERPVDHIKTVRQSDEVTRAPRTSSNNRSRGDSRSKEMEKGMVRLSMDVGSRDGLRPGDVVSTIATLSGIPGKSIGAIDIQSTSTFVDVKDIHVDMVLAKMKKNSRIRGKKIQLTRVS